MQFIEAYELRKKWIVPPLVVINYQSGELDKKHIMPVVAIKRVRIGLNRRPIKGEKVTELMESIKANGLLNPITVDREYNLIAGLHRLTACKMLGYDEIECHILDYEDGKQARLAEIDENLIRSELDALERAELWEERDRLLEQMGIRAKRGQNQYSRKGGELISPPSKTTSELAKELGYNERTLQQGKQIAKSILPEVKKVIERTPIAKSPTALLKIARAGSKEREKAELAEKNAREAEAERRLEEAQKYTQLAAQAREKQKELQLTALRSVTAQKEVKLVRKQKKAKFIATTDEINVQVGDEWSLDRHLVYCGNTSSDEFINLLPSNAALAIVIPGCSWNYDYLVDEARVVAVLRSEGTIHELCRQHRMPFRFELLIGDLYVAIFSYELIPAPQKPIEIEGLEGAVAYLMHMYTAQGNFAIAPSIGHGEVLIACERMGRICFTGDNNPQLVSLAIARWQQWTGKQAIKNL